MKKNAVEAKGIGDLSIRKGKDGTGTLHIYAVYIGIFVHTTYNHE